MVTEDDVRQALTSVRYPGYSRDIVSFGMVHTVQVTGSVIRLTLSIGSQDEAKIAEIKAAATAVLRKLPGITRVDITVTNPSAEPATPTQAMPNVKASIAVGSGKGGVGKTTVAVNLAVALAEQGIKVGLLDADVHGPNVPRMMGVNREPEARNGRILPLEGYGVKLMSIGFLIPQDQPVVWRGPLVGKLIEQFLTDVDWGDLDFLLIDLPPGTGDAQLSLTQKLPLDGAIIVTTPQRVALEDAVKGLLMFQKVNVPITGIIENMSYFVCPHCGQRTDIFDHGNVQREAERLGVPYLGEIPLDPAIRIGGDEGKPILIATPSSPQAEAFRTIAERLAGMIAPSSVTTSTKANKHMVG